MGHTTSRHHHGRRRPRQPGRVAVNTVQLAMTRAARLSAADVDAQLHIIRTALAEFRRGIRCPAHWESLADTANMAETLASMGLGSGPEADQAIHDAQAALHDVHVRHQQRGTWALRAPELDALQLLVGLHQVQLQACSYGELDAALRITHERVSQARAGNAPANAIVVDGQLGQPGQMPNVKGHPNADVAG